MKTKLSVNINKVALIRNARGHNVPDVLFFAQTAVQLGADGITLHPRPDERHARRQDAFDLKKALSPKTELNIEGRPESDFIDFVLQVKPTQCTLVPDAPQALTSDSGWKFPESIEYLTPIVETLKQAGIRVSIFINPTVADVGFAHQTGTQAVELYTGPYAEQYAINARQAVEPYVHCAAEAARLGLVLNAGHDLNLQNLSWLKQQLPNLAEVSIGQALISDCLYLGLAETIKRYRQCLEEN
jgi:pyridoxine 5-phosphate synthase